MPPELNPYQAPAVDVVASHRQAAVDLPLASRGSRFLARFVDNLLLYLPPLAVYVAGIVLTRGAEVGPAPPGLLLVSIGAAALLYLTELAGFLWMLHDSGQTPGKRLLGIRIVADDGRRADIWKIALLRMGVPFAIGSFCSLFGLIDALLIFGTDVCCLHDYLASTRVVDASYQPGL